jgi:hypothetical protein
MPYYQRKLNNLSEEGGVLYLCTYFMDEYVHHKLKLKRRSTFLGARRQIYLRYDTENIDSLVTYAYYDAQERVSDGMGSVAVHA